MILSSIEHECNFFLKLPWKTLDTQNLNGGLGQTSLAAKIVDRGVRGGRLFRLPTLPYLTLPYLNPFVPHCVCYVIGATIDPSAIILALCLKLM